MAFVASAVYQSTRSGFTSCCVQQKQQAASAPTRNGAAVMMATKPRKSRRFVPGKGGAAATKKKLDPEEVYMEVAPSWTEMIIPTISILTVIGIIPFIGSLARQAWVRYKLTNRRISIASGFQGKEQTEIIYRDIEKVKFVRRVAGTGDMVLWLKDGAKLELRTVPELDKMFDYIMTKVDEEAKNESGAA